jgi:hypothetical protein
MVSGKLIEIHPGMKIVDPREQKTSQPLEDKEINARVAAIIKDLSKKENKSDAKN